MPDALTNPQLSKPTFQEGVDNLWRFQLRKEHAALLEKANANIKYLEQLAAETNKSKKDFDERMAALEGKILSFKNEDKKFRHGFEQYVEDMAMLKTQMGNAMDKLETHDRQLDGVAMASLNNRTASSPENGASFMNVLEAPSRSPATTTSLEVTHQEPPSTGEALKQVPELVQSPTDAEAHTTDFALYPSPHFTGPMTRTRSQTRSQSVEAPASKQPQDQAPNPPARPKAPAPVSCPTKASTSTIQPIKLPRLHQGTGTFKNYLNKVDSIYQAFGWPKEKKFEIEFIAAFIKGVRDADTREALVEELQQQHQSRTKKDGKVEILCAWEDVGDAMRSAGLLNVPEIASSSASKSHTASKSHKSRLTKELQGLLEN